MIERIRHWFCTRYWRRTLGAGRGDWKHLPEEREAACGVEFDPKAFMEGGKFFTLKRGHQLPDLPEDA